MLVKIMLTALIFGILSMGVAAYEREANGDIESTTAVVFALCLAVFVVSVVGILLEVIWL
jgi:hypothetical protein